MKLLMALTEALGFDIEKTNDVSYGRTITAGQRSSWHGNKSVADGEWQFFSATSEMPEAEYREIIRSVDYKLTKKQALPKTVCNNLLDEFKHAIDMIESEWGECPKSIIDAYIAAGGKHEDI